MPYLPCGFVPTLLDLLEQPSHPELLLLQRGGHQQHLLGSGGVIGHLARSDHLPCPNSVVPVQLYAAS